MKRRHPLLRSSTPSSHLAAAQFVTPSTIVHLHLLLLLCCLPPSTVQEMVSVAVAELEDYVCVEKWMLAQWPELNAIVVIGEDNKVSQFKMPNIKVGNQTLRFWTLTPVARGQHFKFTIDNYDQADVHVKEDGNPATCMDYIRAETEFPRDCAFKGEAPVCDKAGKCSESFTAKCLNEDGYTRTIPGDTDGSPLYIGQFDMWRDGSKSPCSWTANFADANHRYQLLAHKTKLPASVHSGAAQLKDARNCLSEEHDFELAPPSSPSSSPSSFSSCADHSVYVFLFVLLGLLFFTDVGLAAFYVFWMSEDDFAAADPNADIGAQRQQTRGWKYTKYKSNVHKNPKNMMTTGAAGLTNTNVTKTKTNLTKAKTKGKLTKTGANVPKTKSKFIAMPSTLKTKAKK